MSEPTLPICLPDPDTVCQRIAAAEDELKALRRLYRACMAEQRARAARERRQTLEQEAPRA
jgi:hypothetical protein